MRGDAHRGRGGRGPPGVWEGGGRTPRGSGGGRFRGGGPGVCFPNCTYGHMLHLHLFAEQNTTLLPRGVSSEILEDLLVRLDHDSSV